ncbi:hypothetical protein CHISP_0243 [Chitinispirillum alkaliphilum]|nr:hypothetical protein CHISP_0243 [Chitinispirillum alkaliphilum]
MSIDVVEVKRRLLALLNDPNMVNDYLRRYGPVIDIKKIKAVKKNRASDSLPNRENDPIYEITVKCPVCNQDKITGYELRAKTQQVVQNRFLVPSYEGTMNYETVDYSLLAVTVCPRCLFASPDKKDFIKKQLSGPGEVKSQLSSHIIMSIQERTGERKAQLSPVSDFTSYFNRPRNFEASIDSYKLAMSRAKAESWHEQPYSYFKLGSYALRVAKIMQDNHIDDTDILKEALGYFGEAFRTSNCPSEELELQTIYLIVALCLRLNESKKAHSYIGVFTNLKNTRLEEMRENPKLNTTAIDRWNDRAKFLWEERDDPDLFK